jgi:hypothetical protein
MSDDNHEIIESENNGNREDYGYRPLPLLLLRKVNIKAKGSHHHHL